MVDLGKKVLLFEVLIVSFCLPSKLLSLSLEHEVKKINRFKRIKILKFFN